jgi:hypothetical protein
MSREYHALWHERVDDEDRDYGKLLAIYSSQEQAERGLALLQDKPDSGITRMGLKFLTVQRIRRA